MSRRDVDLPPAIRRNYGSDHWLIGRTEETVLYLTARNQLHLICGPDGMTVPTVSLHDEAAEPDTGNCPCWRAFRVDLFSLTLVRRKPVKEGKDGLDT